jgi:ABC-type phosphate/phosphonate transport system substrate-binding protein
VVRRDDPAATATDCAKAGYVFAYNEGLSQSGWGAPQAWAAAQGLALRPGPKTGAHLASLQAVADGRADWAATDAITLRMAQRWQSGLTDQLRIVGQSAPSPGMTLITRLDQPAEPYAAAITEALAQLPAEIAQILGICGFYRLPQSAYDIALPTPPDPA